MSEYGRIHTDGSRSGGEAAGSDAEAMRYGFDGFGYKYIDSGSGSDWRTRHPDAEPLYLGQPTHSNIFDASDVQKHTLIVDQDYASHTVKVKSLDDSQPTQSDAEITEADCNVAEYIAGDRARDLDYQVVAYHREWSVLEERAKIVAWLHEQHDVYNPSDNWSAYWAERIEAGEHLK